MDELSLKEQLKRAQLETRMSAAADKATKRADKYKERSEQFQSRIQQYERYNDHYQDQNYMEDQDKDRAQNIGADETEGNHNNTQYEQKDQNGMRKQIHDLLAEVNRLKTRQHPTSEEVDQRLKELKIKKLQADIKQNKFENIRKAIGPYNSAINSETWITKLEEQRIQTKVTWKDFLSYMRYFFADSKDKKVDTWFVRKEVILVEDHKNAQDDEARENIWKEFRNQFIAMFDPQLSADHAEDKYEQFQLAEKSAEEFVTQLLDIILEINPKMEVYQILKKMYRKLPIELRPEIDETYWNSLPRFKKRLEIVLTKVSNLKEIEKPVNNKRPAPSLTQSEATAEVVKKARFQGLSVRDRKTTTNTINYEENRKRRLLPELPVKTSKRRNPPAGICSSDDPEYTVGQWQEKGTMVPTSSDKERKYMQSWTLLVAELRA